MDWPDFEYARASFLTGQRRSVTPKAPHSGAQYLLIDDRSPDEAMSGLLGFPGTYPVGCCVPDESLHDHSDLAAELFNLLIFRTGRPFEDRNSAMERHDWSQVVWDLLETGVRKSFKRKNSGRPHAPRSSGDALEMLDGTAVARTSSSLSCSTVASIIGSSDAHFLYSQHDGLPPNKLDRERDSYEDGNGVSVVLIETSEYESEG
jgi:hypothetical protein